MEVLTSVMNMLSNDDNDEGNLRSIVVPLVHGAASGHAKKGIKIRNQHEGRGVRQVIKHSLPARYGLFVHVSHDGGQLEGVLARRPQPKPAGGGIQLRSKSTAFQVLNDNEPAKSEKAFGETKHVRLYNRE